MRTARKVASVVVLGDLVWFASLRLASSLLTPAAWVLTPPPWSLVVSCAPRGDGNCPPWEVLVGGREHLSPYPARSEMIWLP